jgi:hypothetical protein
MQEMEILATRLELHDELVEHHLTQRVGRAHSPRDQPHRHIAVARKGRLDDWEIQPHGPEMKFTKYLGHAVNSAPCCSGASTARSALPISDKTLGSFSIRRRDSKARGTSGLL